MDPTALINVLLASAPAKYVALILALGSVCSAIIAIFPPPKNTKTGWAYIYRALEWLSLSIGHGKTAARAVVNGEVVPAPRPLKPPPAPPPAPAPAAHA